MVSRVSGSTPLNASEAYIQGAQLSDENRRLLIEEGALEKETPTYGDNPHRFLAKTDVKADQSESPSHPQLSQSLEM